MKFYENYTFIDTITSAIKTARLLESGEELHVFRLLFKLYRIVIALKIKLNFHIILQNPPKTSNRIMGEMNFSGYKSRSSLDLY